MTLPVISEIRSRSRVVGFESLRTVRIVFGCLGAAVRDRSPDSGAGRKSTERRGPAVTARIAIAPSVVVMVMMPSSSPLNGDDVGGHTGRALYSKRCGRRAVHAETVHPKAVRSKGGRKQRACDGQLLQMSHFRSPFITLRVGPIHLLAQGSIAQGTNAYPSEQRKRMAMTHRWPEGVRTETYVPSRHAVTAARAHRKMSSRGKDKIRAAKIISRREYGSDARVRAVFRWAANLARPTLLEQSPSR